MEAALLEGAQPYSCDLGTDGVLILHGFTGQPRSMRALAEAFAEAGFQVELPLLPGHGTSVEDLERYRFEDWVGAADRVYGELARRTEHVVVVGLSMGGTLACWLAEAHIQIAGLILINPLIEQISPEQMEALHVELLEGRTTFPSGGSDVKRVGASGGGYDATPILPLLSLLHGTHGVERNLAKISAPVLLFSSQVDHVVPPSSGDTIVRQVHSEVERVCLKNSFHVATIDNDAPELEERAVGFARKVVSG